MTLWNEKHGFPDGETPEENMRYVSPGVVTWNCYDGQYIDLEEFLALTLKATGLL